MAKYVLLSFDKDNDADNFVEAMQSKMNVLFPVKTAEVQDPVEFRMVNLPESTFVRGVYKKPTQFHDPTTCKAGKQTGFTRGTKWGWMVCASCGKPTQGWAKGDGWFSALGTNLLPLSQTAPEYRGIGKPGCFWNEDTQQWEPYEGARVEEVVNILNAPGGSPVGIHVSTPPSGKDLGAASK